MLISLLSVLYIPLIIHVMDDTIALGVFLKLVLRTVGHRCEIHKAVAWLLSITVFTTASRYRGSDLRGGGEKN